MSDIKDGGPAYPNITPDMIVPGSPGMSLRDWFAGQALVGIGIWSPGDDAMNKGNRASWAYAQADAMLKARETPHD